MGRIVSPKVERPMSMVYEDPMNVIYKDMPKKRVLVLKNYITLTEVYLNNNEVLECDVSIKPSDIACMKDVKSDKYASIKTSVYLKNFTNRCQGFNFDGPILVKETQEEIDLLITNFYSGKKGRGVSSE